MSDQWTHTDSMEDNSDWNNLDPIPLVNLLEDSTFEPAVHDEEIVSFSVEYGVSFYPQRQCGNNYISGCG